jgi:hypothetical protein
VLDASGAAAAAEALLPKSVRPRQLSARTLLIGFMLALAEGRPAHLTRVLAALSGLGTDDRARLGVVADWRGGPHALSYRQVEHTARLLAGVLAKARPDGEPSGALSDLVAALLGASVPPWAAALSSSLAVDWTDLESFARPPLYNGAPCAGPEASWGHRRGDGPGQKDELFWGYYLSAATMVAEEGGRAVPELVRAAKLSSCHVDPVPAMVPVIEELVASGTPVGDVLADSGYAHRVAPHWALPLRALGAKLVTDLHPADRGPRGTFGGAICANGNLYCPATPVALLGLGPLGRGATAEQVAAHDKTSAELARYKLCRVSADDADGYRRVGCPAVMGKVRCPARPASMALSHERPTVLGWGQHHPSTVPPAVPKRPSPCRLRSTPKRHRSTTTPRPPGGRRMPGAQRWNAATPPSKTRPATTSPGVGAGSWA